MSSTSSLHTEFDVFSALCWSIGTPVAYKALLSLRKHDWLGLVSIKVQPADYVCAKTLYGDLQIAAFFKKFPGFDLGLDLKADAIKSFYSGEAQCYRSNERLSPLLSDSHHYGTGVKRLIDVWRKEVRQVLGRAPSPATLAGRFGPGSTYLNLGDEITLAHKLSENYSITELAKTFLQSWDETAWSRYAACGLDTSGDDFVAEHHGQSLYSSDQAFAIRDITTVRGNRFTTVPKDARKLRGICVEPSVNVFFQLAVGRKIEQRMGIALGWNKATCQQDHKILAQIGSLTGAISTIDLASASDSICKNLVRLLLPSDWWRLVDDLRSPFTLINERWVRLEKFSSMGNGFTFELETLLFWTLARSIQLIEGVKEDPYTPGLTTSVFGDDIICPTSVSRSLIAALGFFGFTTNDQKTFVSGNFRESCGGDFFSGYNVRPHFHKVTIEEPSHAITLANGLRRFGRLSGALGFPSAYRASWFKCLDSIPRNIRRCRGPEQLGDLVIHDDEERWLTENPMRVVSSIRYLRVWRPVPNRVIGWDNFRPGVVMAVALYGGSSGTPSLSVACTSSRDLLDLYRRSGIIPRVNGSYVSGYRFGRVAYS